MLLAGDSEHAPHTQVQGAHRAPLLTSKDDELLASQRASQQGPATMRAAHAAMRAAHAAAAAGAQYQEVPQSVPPGVVHFQGVAQPASSNAYSGGRRFVATGVVQSWRTGEIVRQVGDVIEHSVLGNVVPTFRCKICLSNLPLTQRIVFQDCNNPDHGCCAECTRNWMEERIKTGLVHSLLCSRRGNVDCRARARQGEVRQLTDEQTWETYRRFKRMSEDASLRECPFCGTFCRPAVSMTGEIVPQMNCPSCSSSFCFYHSNAHAGSSCDEYSREISRQLTEMRRGVMADTKQCPKCGIHTVKPDGCHHMMCAERTCKVHWCWACEQEIQGGANGVAQHYGRGRCRQFPTAEETTTPGCWLTFLKAITFPFRLFFLTLGALLIPVCVVVAPIVMILSLISSQKMAEHWAWMRCHPFRGQTQEFFKNLLMAPALLIFGLCSLIFSVVMGSLTLVLVFFFGCCVPRRFGEFDHTHMVWICSLPFESLEPLRPFLQWYFEPWPCCAVCDDCDAPPGLGEDLVPLPPSPHGESGGEINDNNEESDSE